MPGRRVVCLLLGLGLGLPAPARASEDLTSTLNAETRVPLAFVLSNPTGEVAQTSRSEMIRVVSDLLRDRTDFALQVVDPSALKECRGRLTCLTLKVRRDYQRPALLLPQGGTIPYREHVRRLRNAQTPYPRYLLVVSNITSARKADRMSSVLIDTDLALQIYHDANRNRPDWSTDVEVRIGNGATVTKPIRARVRNASETTKYLQALFEVHFRSTFERTQHWEPYGRLEIECAIPGLVVEMDGRPLGTTQTNLTRVRGLHPGRHRIALNHPNYEPAQAEVEITRAQTTRVSLTPKRRPGSGAPLKTALLWTGAAVAATGVGVLTYGLTRPSDVTLTCIGNVCDSGQNFVTFGYDPDQADRNPLQVNPSGVLIAPLGYSLIGAGAAWGLGSWLTDEEDLPWIAFVVGLAIGGVSYGLSAALN